MRSFAHVSTQTGYKGYPFRQTTIRGYAVSADTVDLPGGRWRRDRGLLPARFRQLIRGSVSAAAGLPCGPSELLIYVTVPSTAWLPDCRYAAMLEARTRRGCRLVIGRAIECRASVEWSVLWRSQRPKRKESTWPDKREPRYFRPSAWILPIFATKEPTNWPDPCRSNRQRRDQPLLSFACSAPTS